jgi:BirA family biotin operon repressor/biotin-[acetyl-CoA-carboxylase] ligase
MNPRNLLALLSATQAVSGSELAAQMGVTRAAVWKQVEALRAMGAPIEAVAGQGYRLAWPVELLDAAAIAGELDAGQRRRIGAIETHWQIDSTNSELLRRAMADPRDLLVCCAETQSAGRGRRERQWRSPLCGNIYFSLLKRFGHGMGALSGLSLATGVAAVTALTDYGVRGAGLKWPNDVLVDGRKLAGILIELGGEFLGPCHAVVGIGINLRLGDEVKAGIETPATDLASVMQEAPSRNRIAGRLLARLIEMLDEFSEQGFAPFREKYAGYDLLAGRSVMVHAAAGARAGIAEGVDERGALRVRHEATIAHYDSAEVSVRQT